MFLDRKIKISYWDKAFIKDVIAKALPFIIATIINSLITLMDNWMIGIFQSFNASELAAASLANKFVNMAIILINSAIAMFGFLVFQYKGKNDLTKMQSVFKIMIQFVILVSVISIIIGHFAQNQIMQFFQGDNYQDLSTKSGLAQSYMNVLMLKLLPFSIFSVLIIGLITYGKQKILIPLSGISLLINILGNYLFYQVFNLGLNGIAYSTILAETTALLIVIWWIYHCRINRGILFNILTIFFIDFHVLVLGLKRYLMAFQNILWSFISIGITIIYSRWFGDVANNKIAIAMPIVAMFYTALNGIAATKGYFVGIAIGQGNQQKAYINDKKINMYTFISATTEGILLIALAFALPYAWVNAARNDQWGATLMLIAVGLTYPIAAMSKAMLGSFKVAGMGKIIILSNGLFALFFEFAIPLILYLISLYFDLNIEFWQLFWLSRGIKLIKLPPTLYFWRKLTWLEKVV